MGCRVIQPHWIVDADKKRLLGKRSWSAPIEVQSRRRRPECAWADDGSNPLSQACLAWGQDVRYTAKM